MMRILLLGLGFWGRNWYEVIGRSQRWTLAGVAAALLARYCQEISALFNLADSLDIRTEVEARLNLIA